MADTTREIKAYAEISNRYVVDGGSYAVALYETTLSPERLTFGQLISAVSIRLAAADEAHAITSMNRLVNNIGFSSLLATVVEKLTEAPNGSNKLTWDTDVWTLVDEKVKKGEVPGKNDYDYRSAAFKNKPTLENFVIYECGVTLSTALPADDGTTRDLQYVKSRLDAYTLIRPTMEGITRASELLQVDVETSVGRRDVALTTATNIIKAFSATLLSAAQAMKR